MNSSHKIMSKEGSSLYNYLRNCGAFSSSRYAGTHARVTVIMIGFLSCVKETKRRQILDSEEQRA